MLVIVFLDLLPILFGMIFCLLSGPLPFHGEMPFDALAKNLGQVSQRAFEPGINHLCEREYFCTAVKPWPMSLCPYVSPAKMTGQNMPNFSLYSQGFIRVCVCVCGGGGGGGGGADMGKLMAR